MSFRTLFDIPFNILPVYVLRCERWSNAEWQRITSKPHPRPLSKGRGEMIVIKSLPFWGRFGGGFSYRQLVTPSVVAMAVRTDITT